MASAKERTLELSVVVVGCRCRICGGVFIISSIRIKRPIETYRLYSSLCGDLLPANKAKSHSMAILVVIITKDLVVLDKKGCAQN